MNSDLHTATSIHINNLKVVESGLESVKEFIKFIPSINELLLNPKEDLETINTMRKLCEKVDVKCDY